MKAPAFAGGKWLGSMRLQWADWPRFLGSGNDS